MLINTSNLCQFRVPVVGKKKTQNKSVFCVYHYCFAFPQNLNQVQWPSESKSFVFFLKRGENAHFFFLQAMTTNTNMGPRGEPAKVCFSLSGTGCLEPGGMTGP